MRTALITSWHHLSGLKDEWNKLLHSSASDTVFLTWEWIQAWRSVVGEHAKLLVITVRDHDDRLVGLAPFYRYQLKLFNLIPFNALRVLGDYATGAEYPDWIVSSDCEEKALAAITHALLEASDQWDVIWMPQLSGWNGAYERITSAIHQANMLFHSRPTAFSSISLPRSFDLFEQRFTSKRRKNLRRARRNLLSKPDIDILYCRDYPELPRYLNALFELHHKRRMLLGDPGCFIRKPAEAAFYRQFVPAALEKGWLRFTALTQNDKIEAIQIGYAYNGEYLAMQEGFNPDFIDGAGNVLRHVSIEKSIEEGLENYDFLGGVSQHKKLWKAQERDGHDLLIARPSLKNWLLFRKKIWPTGRYIKEQGLFDGN